MRVEERTGRNLLRERSGDVCEICSSDRAVAWHHRKRRSQGGTWAASNGLHLCTACHQMVHSSVEKSYANGWLVRPKMQPGDMPALIRIGYGRHYMWLYDDGSTQLADMDAPLRAVLREVTE